MYALKCSVGRLALHAIAHTTDRPKGAVKKKQNKLVHQASGGDGWLNTCKHQRGLHNNSAEQGCRVTHQSPEVITTHPPENVGGLFGVLLLIRCQHVHNLLCVHAVVVRQVLHQLPRRFLPFLCVHIIGQEAVALAAV